MRIESNSIQQYGQDCPVRMTDNLLIVMHRFALLRSSQRCQLFSFQRASVTMKHSDAISLEKIAHGKIVSPRCAPDLAGSAISKYQPRFLASYEINPTG